MVGHGMMSAGRQRARRLKVVRLEPKKRKQKSTCAQISLRNIDEPRSPDLESHIEWLFKCLGFGDDEDRVAKEVFKEILRNARNGVRSADIRGKCNVTQGAVVYHLNTLMQKGLVIKQGRLYYLKKPSVEATLGELEEEIVGRFERIKRIAKMMDEMIGCE